MDPSRTLYIENFPLKTSEITIKKLFSNFGKIKRIDLPTFVPEHPLCRGLAKPKSKGYAFIEFSDATHVQKACNYFNDISNILCEQEDRSISTGLEAGNSGARIADNLEYKNLKLLRVMPKRVYLELVKRYEESRFKSLMRAAKYLAIT